MRTNQWHDLALKFSEPVPAMSEGSMRMSNAAEMTIGSIPPVPFQQEGQPQDSGEIIAYFLRGFV